MFYVRVCACFVSVRVRACSQEEKKRFLSFCTGSDRSPIKGLGSLKFVISRAGPDSEQYVLQLLLWTSSAR